MSVGSGRAKYAPPDLGPFKCEHCEYFKRPTLCGNPVVLRDARSGVLPMLNGKAVVHPRGCCNEYEPKTE